MDFPEVVDQGLNQMVKSINDPEAILDVCLLPEQISLSLSLFLTHTHTHFQSI
jgi:hypothetical protein